MKCLLINLIVFVTVVNNSNTRKPLFLPQLPLLEFNLAIKDSIGSWKENAYFYNSPKACSSLKMFMGNAWIPVLKSAGVGYLSCPISAGEYRVKLLAVFRSESSNDQIQYNLYQSKTSVNTTEIKGNLTYLVPFDDSFNFEFNLAIKDSVNGWKDNAYVYRTAKACSSLKKLMGTFWNDVAQSFGVQNISCPIPVGCYKTSGFRLDKNFYSNLPKQFFYGTYKPRVQFTKNKVVHGCITSVIEVKRPWETD